MQSAESSVKEQLTITDNSSQSQVLIAVVEDTVRIPVDEMAMTSLDTVDSNNVTEKPGNAATVAVRDETVLLSADSDIATEVGAIGAENVTVVEVASMAQENVSVVQELQEDTAMKVQDKNNTNSIPSSVKTAGESTDVSHDVSFNQNKTTDEISLPTTANITAAVNVSAEEIAILEQRRLEKLKNERRPADQYIMLASAYMSRGQYELALKQLQKAVKRSPDYSDIYMIRASVSLELGDVAQASSDLLKVLELDRCNSTACAYATAIGTQLLTAKRVSESVPLLNASFECNKSDYSLGLAFSSALTSIGEYQRALNVLQHSDNEPWSKSRVMLMTSLYEKTNRTKEAEEVWQKAISLNMSSWSELGKFRWHL